MKIVDVTEFYSERGGGVRSHLTSKGHVLCQLGHDHVVVAPGPRDSEERLPYSVRDGGSIVLETTSARIVRVAGPSLPYDPTYHLLGRVDKVRARIARERPDVLEVNSPYLAMAAALSVPRQTFGIRTFFWHADFIDTYLRVALERRLPRRGADAVLAPLWALVRALAERCDATFVAGECQAEKLRARGVPRVICVPFGVDKKTFTPSAASEARRRELLGEAYATSANGRPPLLLVGVGRFAIEKRWDVVLDAFASVAAERPAVLALFGDGPEREALERRAAPGVRFFGFEKDRAKLASAIASADLYVHGCPYETFGLGVAEAMSCGVPVVVPDQGGAGELVGPDSGLVYRSGDPHACAAAIRTLADGDLQELRARAREGSKAILDVAQHFALVVRCYRELLAQKRSC